MTTERKATRVIIAGWNPLLIDWVGFYRPHLKGCLSKHFAAMAGKALPAIELGMIARPRVVADRAFPLLCGQTRNGQTLSLLQAARSQQQQSDVLVADRQVKISYLSKAHQQSQSPNVRDSRGGGRHRTGKGDSCQDGTRSETD